MKRVLFVFGFILTTVLAHAQAILPTNWSFTTATLPNGWTESGTAFYTASGNTPPAMKFDNTGDYLIINFAGNPGNLTYYLAGNSFSGGTFKVEESDLGTTWTTLRTHTSPPSATYTQFTDVPQSTTRYIRFIYTTKVTGNIGLDDVNIAVGAATPPQEINVKQGSSVILTGGDAYLSSPVSTMTPTTFTIENLGTSNTLTISNATISGGANAADFSVASFPSSVTALSNSSLVVNFTPSNSGTRNAVLSIFSNDSDESTYTINLIGFGGGLASEPTAQPTNLALTNVKTYRISGSFTPVSGVDGYLVLRKKGSAITGLPTDGVIYQKGDIVGDAQVVYCSNATSFAANNIVASTGYYFSVFAYNGPGSYRNYLTTSPLTANVTTPATMMPAGMYNGIDMMSTTFVTDLHNLVNPHTVQFYSSYGPLMVSDFEARDTVQGQRVVTCVYSGENKVYTEPFDFTSNGYSREHTYAHSWMATNPAQSLPEYSDYHHLFPTNLNNANILRSNYPLGKVVTPSSTFMGCKLGLDANGKTVFEPRDEHKGDAARAMLYMTICYTTVSGNLWALPSNISSSVPYGQDQAILKTWHFNDPPSNWEIARNDYVDSLQNNRNPFIDNVDYACFVNFSNMTYESLGCEASIQDKLNTGFIAYPNPAKDELTLHVDATNISRYEVYDATGRLVLSNEVNDLVMVKVNITSLRNGNYVLKAFTPHGVAQRSISIQ